MSEFELERPVEFPKERIQAVEVAIRDILRVPDDVVYTVTLAVLRADEAYRREQRERHMADPDFRERPRGLPGTFNGA